MENDKIEIPAATQPQPARAYIRRRAHMQARRSVPTIPAPPSKSMTTTYPYVQPSTQEIKWQGADLALAQLQQFLDTIKRELQPMRADIIGKAAEDGIKVVALMQQWVDALPPGTA